MCMIPTSFCQFCQAQTWARFDFGSPSGRAAVLPLPRHRFFATIVFYDGPNN